MKFPLHLANTTFELALFDDGVSKTGSNLILKRAAGRCIFIEKSQAIIYADSKRIKSTGYLIIKGDIAPELAVISSGEVNVNGCKYSIAGCDRIRDSSGKVFSTEVFLK